MTLEIVFWDVQHGSSTYINTPNGTKIVQDLGTGSYQGGSEFSPLLHLKNKYNVRRLDEVIVTHPDKDHIDDIHNFGELDPRYFHRPKHLSESDIMKGVRPQDRHLFEQFLRIDERYTGRSGGDTPHDVSYNGGVDITTFTPSGSSTSNLNNHSIVTILEYANQKVILPGDNESPSWNELLDRNTFTSAIRGADILLAPHHGRKSGFHSPLFDYFEPYLTIISDGQYQDTSATNRYGDVTRGWKVHNRNSGYSSDKKCLTTRSNGVITIDIGWNGDDPFIEATVDSF